MKINFKTAEAYKLFHEGTLAFARAEQQGIQVDLDIVQRKIFHITRKMERFEEKFKETDFFKHWEHTKKGKVNINSGTQLGHFLYDIKKIKPAKLTETGKGATDEDSLKQLNIPELNLLLEKTRYKKPLDVLRGFEREQVDGYIHPFFNLHLVRSFRSSSTNPNFQNIPVRDEEVMQICRGALFPRPGHQLLEIDFKSIEVTINACYNKDTTLVKYVSNPASDMHRDMTKQIFLVDNFDKEKHNILRQATKNGFVFPEFYGDYYKNCASNLVCNWGKLPEGKWSRGQGIKLDEGPFTLSDHLISKGINSYGEFENHLKKIERDFWDNRFPEYAEWKDRWWKTYQKYGYIDLLTGFRCSGLMGKNDCINYPGQGTAFHCNLWAFIDLDKIIQSQKWDTRLIGQIHDSLILDVNPNELKHVVRVVKRVTCEDLPKAWKWIIVPLSVDMELAPIDKSWADKEKYVI
jgi:DNA polymerase-1